ncbi:uncharacterized protein LOC134221527 isoform X2 [Armigeres subalbatus]|uniref:uncharacterized protein LOC134221527 isoform X2 n=1 Tax=Armigeres subalbatus TaxID=124917 RepID=UPI002ED4AC10
MRDLSCDIRFPYNWNREFYCGERLQLSVEFRCTKTVEIRGVELCVHCQNAGHEPADEYGRYIYDQDETDNDSKQGSTGVSEFKTNIDLLGNNDHPVRFLRGTQIFNVNCRLPDKISDQCCNEEEQLSLTVSVRIRKIAKTEQHASVKLMHVIGKRQTSFTWPGNYGNICSYSNVAVDINSFYVSNVDEANNRDSYEDEEYLENVLEGWLGCIPMQGEPLDEDCLSSEDIG